MRMSIALRMAHPFVLWAFIEWFQCSTNINFFFSSFHTRYFHFVSNVCSNMAFTWQFCFLSFFFASIIDDEKNKLKWFFCSSKYYCLWIHKNDKIRDIFFEMSKEQIWISEGRIVYTKMYIWMYDCMWYNSTSFFSYFYGSLFYCNIAQCLALFFQFTKSIFFIWFWQFLFYVNEFWHSMLYTFPALSVRYRIIKRMQ